MSFLVNLGSSFQDPHFPTQILYFYPINTWQKRNSLTPPCCHLPADCLFVGAGGGERMLETGAVSSQDGAGRGSDGEGLAAAPDEEPESQHQLDPAVFSSPYHSRPVKLSQPTAHLHPSGPEVEARLCYGRQNGDFTNKTSLSTCTFIQRATT